jgi:hypothetical protein
MESSSQDNLVAIYCVRKLNGVLTQGNLMNS